MATGAKGTNPANRVAMRDLLRAGFTPGQAANLIGLSYGLRPVEGGGWTLREIERLRFARHLAARGQVSG
jgi:hypothetical protein